MDKFRKTTKGTNWSSATNNYWTAIKALKSALQSGYKAVLIKEWNYNCEYPVFTKKDEPKPWIHKEPKVFKHKVWVVQLLDDNDIRESSRFIKASIKIQHIITYPLRYIPKRSYKLNMDKYTSICYSVGSVQNGYSITINIPKKFSFKD